MGSDLRRVNTFWQRRFVSQTLRQSAFVVPVSEDLTRYAIQFGASPERVRTIRRGCHTSIFHLADRQTARIHLQVREDAELIVFVGRLVEVKGLRELFEALPPLMAARPALELACIGGGPLEQELRSCAVRSGIAGRVRFLGGLEPRSVAQWLTASNLLCLPSHSEGFPNVIMEALSCGRAVVASNVGGIPEIVDHTCGILTPPQDAAQLAEALSAGLDRAWDEEWIAAKFSRSWEDSAREIYDVCLQVLEEQGWSSGRVSNRVARV
jgi:glycosyltransferase involved in cell wall biosynthesis